MGGRLDGISATRAITAAQPEVRVLVVSMPDDDASIFAVLTKLHATDRTDIAIRARNAGLGQP